MEIVRLRYTDCQRYQAERKSACFSWKIAMLEFAEAVLKEVRKLQGQSEQIVLSGTISDMERYRFMMGRLEGLKMVEESVKALLRKHTDNRD
jgi:hypothetical protein